MLPSMEQPFELTKPGPTLAEMVKREELIDRIKVLANLRKQRRPTLEAWSFRIEKRLHQDLKLAGRQLEPVAMSDVVNGLLELFLPIILAQRAKPGATLDTNQRAQITGLLKQLSGLIDGQSLV